MSNSFYQRLNSRLILVLTAVTPTSLFLVILLWASTDTGLIFALGGDDPERGKLSDSSVILIGATAPLSAPGDSSAGEAMKVAFEIAVDNLNADGGVLGMPVQLVISDTAGTAVPVAVAGASAASGVSGGRF